MAVYSKTFIMHLGGRRMLLQWIPLRASSVRPSVCARVNMCLCMCEFACLCLCIPRANRATSSRPWSCIDRECGICRVFLSISLCERAGGGVVGYNKVTQRRVTLCCYLWLFWPNIKGRTAPYTKTQHVMIATGVTDTIRKLLFGKVCSLHHEAINCSKQTHHQIWN